MLKEILPGNIIGSRVDDIIMLDILGRWRNCEYVNIFILIQ